METDVELATRVAKLAGQLLLELRESIGSFDRSDIATRKKLKDEGDRAANELIVTALTAARPGDAILTEEAFDEDNRDTARRVWIIDPLDGTSEYGLGRADFAVHIALWDREATTPEKLVAGAVDLPAQQITRTTADVSAHPPPLAADRPIRIVVSRSRPPQIARSGIEKLARAMAEAGITDMGVEVINYGSVGAKVNEVLSGRAEAYLHDTGFYEWDVAAPLAVAQHYGLTATHIDGEHITFNHRPPWVRSLTVCLPQLTRFLLA